MKKLLFVISQLYKGGAETALVNLLNHLDTTKYEIELLILNQAPVENAVSLIPKVNKKIKICDAYKEYQKVTLWNRVEAKFIYTMEQKGAYYLPALDFVRNKIYDWAFFIGEWCSPSFVAYEVQAKKKAAWIHNDLSEAEYFDAGHYFYFADRFDYFIFVSQNSLNASVKKYPFLKEKAICIYNINNVNNILKQAKKELKNFPQKNLPVLLTCANFRPQKNHLRQVKVMAELKRRGIEFIWLNIGATTDQRIVNQVKSLCKKEQLENHFLILGAKENPYQYMKRADAIVVLSDYESWSMVITEAKIIGTPVISTKTSGALEQIEDEKTGLLTEFSVKDIADVMEKFLKDKELQKKIRENIKNFDNTKQILNCFEHFLENGKNYTENRTGTNSILYVIDDINYIGGAHFATKLQIKELIKQGRNVTIFSSNIPILSVRMDLNGVNFISWKDFREDVIFHKRMWDCFTDKRVSKKERQEKWKQIKAIHIQKKQDYYGKNILPELKHLFSKYDILCVMSEGSAFRGAAAEANCKKKIQWIHTDYCRWKEFNDWTREITREDEQLYAHYHTIVVLSEQIKWDMAALYPSLADKIEVSRNLMPVEKIIAKSKIKKVSYPSVHFITVGRLSSEKAYDRLIRILVKLKKKGYQFLWEIVGDGPEEENLKSMIKNNKMEKEILLLGQQENPYYYIKKAQIFALLSVYEGMPNTIYEALILGIPVLATNVGGISEQIIDGVNGWLVKNEEEEIMKKIVYLMEHQEEVAEIKRNTEKYHYENETISKKLSKIFSII